jgi:hypothetical protein
MWGSELGRALTIVAVVREDRLEDLRALLGDEDGDPSENRVIDLRRSPRTHFARWVLVDTPGRPALLLFESNHDGSAEDYLAELLAVGGERLVAMYGCCVGFHPKSARGYLLAKRVDHHAFYRAYPARSVGQVKAALDVVARVRRYLDANRRELAALSPVEIHERVQRELLEGGVEPPRHAPVSSLPLQFLTDALQDAVGPVGRERSRATRLLAGILLAPIAALLVVELLAGAALGHAPAIAAGAGAVLLVLFALVVLAIERVSRSETTEPLFDPHHLAGQEDHVTQNQLSHVAILKPGWVRRSLLRLVLGTIDTLARITFTTGHLGGIPSIHFARWVILDDGRLVFFSNFDNSWDSYLGDFIDKASAGLTSVWSNTEGFPETRLLLWGGARDGAAFKAWTRAGQIPTQLWYSAYPRASVQNIRGALVLSEDVFRDSNDPRAGNWLADLA